MNVSLSEIVIITIVTIATLSVPAFVLYLVFRAGRRRATRSPDTDQ